MLLIVTYCYLLLLIVTCYSLLLFVKLVVTYCYLLLLVTYCGAAAVGDAGVGDLGDRRRFREKTSPLHFHTGPPAEPLEEPRPVPAERRPGVNMSFAIRTP